MELSDTPARSLDKFIEDNLLPDTPFRRNVREAIHIISSFLKERCFRDPDEGVRVSKVVKKQLEHRGEFIKEIRRQLEACQREKYFKFKVKFEIQTFERPRALSFTLMSPVWPQEGVEFDVLPAFDALGQWSGDGKPDPDIYVRLIRECEWLGKEGEFSPCFTELQRAFLRRRPTKVKSLIRLVKCWYQQCKEKLGKPLPAQYALELLTVYAWEHGSGETEFSTAQGFRTVLELVLEYERLCIFWEKYYDFENAYINKYLTKQIKRRRPVILDPADPTGNVAGESQLAWQRLAQEAFTWLSYPCFRNWDESAVRAWNVPPEAGSSLEAWAGSGSPFCSFQQHHKVSHSFSSHQDTYTPWEHSPQENEGWSCSIL